MRDGLELRGFPRNGDSLYHRGFAMTAAAPKTTMPPADPIVGIDLGTTNSLVAYCFESGPRVLGGGAGGAMVPSVVRFHADGPATVGDAARRSRTSVRRKRIHGCRS